MVDCLKCWWGVYYPYCPCKEDEERQSGATDKEEAQGMKNLHFCTPELLKVIKNTKIKEFYTYRTGFVPNLYPGDIINLNERADNGEDTFITEGVIKSVEPIRLLNIHESYTFNTPVGEEELKRYKRKFHKMHWFFSICIIKDTKRMFSFAKSMEVQGMDNPCIKCASKQYCEETNGTCGDLEQYRRGEDDES